MRRNDVSTAVDARVRRFRVEVSDKELDDLLSFNQVESGGYFAAFRTLRRQ